MKKVLVEVTSPAAGLTYDMFVPSTLRIGEMVSLISNLFAQTSNGMYVRSEPAVLCERKSGYVYDFRHTVQEADIRNGTKLILF